MASKETYLNSEDEKEKKRRRELDSMWRKNNEKKPSPAKSPKKDNDPIQPILPKPSKTPKGYADKVKDNDIYRNVRPSQKVKLPNGRKTEITPVDPRRKYSDTNYEAMQRYNDYNKQTSGSGLILPKFDRETSITNKSPYDMSLPEKIAYAEQNRIWMDTDGFYAALSREVSTPGHRSYDPYFGKKSTFQEATQFFGVDKFDDQWLVDNAWMEQYAPRVDKMGNHITGNYGSLSTADRKKWSWETQAGYLYQQVEMAMPTTKKAKAEWGNLIADQTDWFNAQRLIGKTPTLDEFMERIDISDYPTLKKMDDSRNIGSDGTSTVVVLNDGVGYSRENLTGLYNALNKGAKVTVDDDLFDYTVDYYMQPIQEKKAKETKYAWQTAFPAMTPEQRQQEDKRIRTSGDREEQTLWNYENFIANGGIPEGAFEGMYVDDAFFERFDPIFDPIIDSMRSFEPNGNGSISEPGKNAPEMQKLAYEYYQIQQKEVDTETIEEQYGQFCEYIQNVVASDPENAGGLLDEKGEVDFEYSGLSEVLSGFPTLKRYMESPENFELNRTLHISKDRILRLVELASQGVDISSLGIDYGLYEAPASSGDGSETQAPETSAMPTQTPEAKSVQTGETPILEKAPAQLPDGYPLASWKPNLENLDPKFWPDLVESGLVTQQEIDTYKAWKAEQTPDESTGMIKGSFDPQSIADDPTAHTPQELRAYLKEIRDAYNAAKEAGGDAFLFFDRYQYEIATIEKALKDMGEPLEEMPEVYTDTGDRVRLEQDENGNWVQAKQFTEGVGGKRDEDKRGVIDNPLPDSLFNVAVGYGLVDPDPERLISSDYKNKLNQAQLASGEEGEAMKAELLASPYYFNDLNGQQLNDFGWWLKTEQENFYKTTGFPFENRSEYYDAQRLSLESQQIELNHRFHYGNMDIDRYTKEYESLALQLEDVDKQMKRSEAVADAFGDVDYRLNATPENDLAMYLKKNLTDIDQRNRTHENWNYVFGGSVERVFPEAPEWVTESARAATNWIPAMAQGGVGAVARIISFFADIGKEAHLFMNRGRYEELFGPGYTIDQARSVDKDLYDLCVTSEKAKRIHDVQTSSVAEPLGAASEFMRGVGYTMTEMKIMNKLGDMVSAPISAVLSPWLKVNTEMVTIADKIRRAAGKGVVGFSHMSPYMTRSFADGADTARSEGYGEDKALEFGMFNATTTGAIEGYVGSLFEGTAGKGLDLVSKLSSKVAFKSKNAMVQAGMSAFDYILSATKAAGGEAFEEVFDVPAEDIGRSLIFGENRSWLDPEYRSARMQTMAANANASFWDMLVAGLMNGMGGSGSASHDAQAMRLVQEMMDDPEGFGKDVKMVIEIIAALEADAAVEIDAEQDTEMEPDAAVEIDAEQDTEMESDAYYDDEGHAEAYEILASIDTDPDAEIKSLKREIDKLEDEYYSGSIDNAAYETHRGSLEGALREAEERANQIASDAAAKEAAQSGDDAQGSSDDIGREITRLEGELEKLEDEYYSGRLDNAQYETRCSALEGMIQEAKERLKLSGPKEVARATLQTETPVQATPPKEDVKAKKSVSHTSLPSNVAAPIPPRVKQIVDYVIEDKPLMIEKVVQARAEEIVEEMKAEGIPNDVNSPASGPNVKISRITTEIDAKSRNLEKTEASIDQSNSDYQAALKAAIDAGIPLESGKIKQTLFNIKQQIGGMTGEREKLLADLETMKQELEKANEEKAARLEAQDRELNKKAYEQASSEIKRELDQAQEDYKQAVKTKADAKAVGGKAEHVTESYLDKTTKIDAKFPGLDDSKEIAEASPYEKQRPQESVLADEYNENKTPLSKMHEVSSALYYEALWTSSMALQQKYASSQEMQASESNGAKQPTFQDFQSYADGANFRTSWGGGEPDPIAGLMKNGTLGGVSKEAKGELAKGNMGIDTQQGEKGGDQYSLIGQNQNYLVVRDGKALESQYAEYQDQLDAEKQGYEAISEQIETLKKNSNKPFAGDRNAELARLDGEIKAAQKKLRALKTQKLTPTAEKDMAALRAERDQMVERATSDINKLVMERNNIENPIGTNSKEMTDLEIELDKHRQNISALRKKLKKVDPSRLAAAKGKHDAAIKALKDAQDEAKRNPDPNVDQEKLAKLKAKFESAYAKFDELNNRMGEAEAEKKGASKQYALARARGDQKTIQAAKERMDKAIEELRSIRPQWEKAKNASDRINAQITNLTFPPLKAGNLKRAVTYARKALQKIEAETGKFLVINKTATGDTAIELRTNDYAKAIQYANRLPENANTYHKRQTHKQRYFLSEEKIREYFPGLSDDLAASGEMPPAYVRDQIIADQIRTDGEANGLDEAEIKAQIQDALQTSNLSKYDESWKDLGGDDNFRLVVRDEYHPARGEKNAGLRSVKDAYRVVSNMLQSLMADKRDPDDKNHFKDPSYSHRATGYGMQKDDTKKSYRFDGFVKIKMPDSTGQGQWITIGEWNGKPNEWRNMLDYKDIVENAIKIEVHGYAKLSMSGPNSRYDFVLERNQGQEGASNPDYDPDAASSFAATDAEIEKRVATATALYLEAVNGNADNAQLNRLAFNYLQTQFDKTGRDIDKVVNLWNAVDKDSPEFASGFQRYNELKQKQQRIALYMREYEEAGEGTGNKKTRTAALVDFMNQVRGMYGDFESTVKHRSRYGEYESDLEKIESLAKSYAEAKTYAERQRIYGEVANLTKDMQAKADDAKIKIGGSALLSELNSIIPSLNEFIEQYQNTEMDEAEKTTVVKALQSELASVERDIDLLTKAGITLDTPSQFDDELKIPYDEKQDVPDNSTVGMRLLERMDELDAEDERLQKEIDSLYSATDAVNLVVRQMAVRQENQTLMEQYMSLKDAAEEQDTQDAAQAPTSLDEQTSDGTGANTSLEEESPQQPQTVPRSESQIPELDDTRTASEIVDEVMNDNQNPPIPPPPIDNEPTSAPEPDDNGEPERPKTALESRLEALISPTTPEQQAANQKANQKNIAQGETLDAAHQAADEANAARDQAAAKEAAWDARTKGGEFVMDDNAPPPSDADAPVDQEAPPPEAPTNEPYDVLTYDVKPVTTPAEAKDASRALQLCDTAISRITDTLDTLAKNGSDDQARKDMLIAKRKALKEKRDAIRTELDAESVQDMLKTEKTVDDALEVGHAASTIPVLRAGDIREAYEDNEAWHNDNDSSMIDGNTTLLTDKQIKSWAKWGRTGKKLAQNKKIGNAISSRVHRLEERLAKVQDSIATLEAAISALKQGEDDTDLRARRDRLNDTRRALETQIENGKQAAKEYHKDAATDVAAMLKGEFGGKLPISVLNKVLAIIDKNSKGKNANRPRIVSRNLAIAKRVIEAYFGKDAPIINKLYIQPILDANSKISADKDKYTDLMYESGIPKDASKIAVDYGEGRITYDDLVKARPNDYQQIIDGLDKVRKVYDELLQRINDTRVRNGYDPIERRHDYFPHVLTGSNSLLEAMGFGSMNDSLPTSLVGKTEDFKPGTPFDSHLLHRNTDQNDAGLYDGFASYIDGALQIIHQTDNIVRLRQLEEALEQMHDVNPEAKNPTQMANFKDWLMEYTNILAGKKGTIDREFEKMFGRNAYTVLRKIKNMRSRALITGNLNVALSNFIPLCKSLASNPTHTIAAVGTMLKNVRFGSEYFTGDGFEADSKFLTRRFQGETIDLTALDKLLKKASVPARFVDRYTANIIVRSLYAQSRSLGLDHKRAMDRADDIAYRLMANKDRGESSNLASSQVGGALLQFAVEPINELFDNFKDMPKRIGQTPGILALLLGYAFQYLFNKSTNKTTAADPFGAVIKTVKGVEEGSNGWDHFTTLAKNLYETGRPVDISFDDGLKGLPIVSGFTGVGDAIGKTIENPGDYVSWEGLASAMLGWAPMGTQIERTYRGGKLIYKGYSESKSGQFRYAFDDADWYNKAVALTLGENSTKAGYAFSHSGGKPLSNIATKQAQTQMNAGLTPSEAYANVMGTSSSKASKTVAKDAQARGNTDTYKSSDAEAKAAREAVTVPSGVPKWAADAHQKPYMVGLIDQWKATGDTDYLPKEFEKTLQYTKDGITKKIDLPEEDRAKIDAKYKGLVKAAYAAFSTNPKKLKTALTNAAKNAKRWYIDAHYGG